MRTRWWLLAFIVAVGAYSRLAPSRQGRGVLLIIALVVVLGLAIAWLSESGPRIRSSGRDMSEMRDTPIDDDLLR